MAKMAPANHHDCAENSLAGQIAELVSAVRQQLNEDTVLDCLSAGLNRFRALYTQDPFQFDSGDITTLQGLATAEQNLRNFVDVLTDSADVCTSDDCHDLITRIAELRGAFTGWAIVGRLDKEMRGLRERAQSLPTYQGAVSAGTRNHKLARIQQIGTDPCPCYGARMLIRGSAFGYFWGCETFPKCFGRRWLKREHLSVLGSP